MSGLRTPKDHVNKVLNHAAGPITEAYDLHTYLPEKAVALQEWADELERITSPTRPKDQGHDAVSENTPWHN